MLTGEQSAWERLKAPSLQQLPHSFYSRQQTALPRGPAARSPAAGGSGSLGSRSRPAPCGSCTWAGSLGGSTTRSSRQEVEDGGGERKLLNQTTITTTTTTAELERWARGMLLENYKWNPNNSKLCSGLINTVYWYRRVVEYKHPYSCRFVRKQRLPAVRWWAWWPGTVWCRRSSWTGGVWPTRGTIRRTDLLRCKDRSKHLAFNIDLVFQSVFNIHLPGSEHSV